MPSVCLEIFKHPMTRSSAFLDKRDAASMLDDIDLIAGLNMKPITQLLRNRDLAFPT